MEPRISRAGAERLDEVQRLWEAMHAHQRSLGGGMPPARAPAESWRLRRARYEAWLADGSGRLLLAELAGSSVGYAFLTIGEGPATWDVGTRAAELESLSVLEEHRGAGVGGLLMRAARAIARADGASAMGVGVVHSNADALRFYEREGFRPFYAELLATDLGEEPG